MKTAIEALFQDMISDGWFTASDGDVASPMGHFAYVTNTQAEVTSIFDAFEDTIKVYGKPEDHEVVGSIVVIEDEQGFVHIERYGSDVAAKARYNVILEAYSLWAEIEGVE